ncbi:MlaD family protein [Nocardia bovistercoris]|uniref:MCE family protein n=1 Tax=Nocardia bovistercoris TaxID=2785916 RepID=A0A931I7E2_9NOCA|nr:MCE family protein [Nocardia bovistercoris]MBH0776307.1 MCE family protein [Nocardia bovistercoris]
MPILFESDDRDLTGPKLLLRGAAFAVVATAVVVAGIIRSQGGFEESIAVTALMSDVGDGLPPKSDVKYRGVLIGMVSEVLPATEGEPTRVRLDMKPEHVAGIPNTVTARVVPSNVFAVPSIQLLDNGAGAPLEAGARIEEDRSLATVQLQTSLTALSRIAAAAGRSRTDPTVGILETVQRATNGSGAEALRAGAQLERIVLAMGEVTTPDGTRSTLDTLSRAIDGLRSSSPDLLAAVHQSVVPLRTMAAQRTRFAEMISAGLITTGTVADAMENNTGTILGITSDMAPVLDILGTGSKNFAQMAVSERVLSDKVRTVLWRADTQSGVPKIIVELTPHKQYTREDCPRYGELAGPSCLTGPPGPGVIGTAETHPATPASDIDERQPWGSPHDLTQLAEILGGPPDALSTALLVPLLRGNDIHVAEGTNSAATAEEPR